jgi:hypothetical protein
MFDFLLAMVSANSQVSNSLQPFLLESKFSNQKVLMTQNSQNLPFSISVTLLEAYEDKVPPPGASINHPVGHAVVRLRIKNLTQNNIKVSLKKIEICQTDNKRVLMSQSANPVNLGGLQIQEQGFHLTNPKGFMGLKKVKAVVTYQLDSKIYTVESPISEVR